MTVTLSQMMPLQTQAPDFSLVDTISGKVLTLESLASSQGTIIIFMCNHCPFVKHILDTLIDVSQRYQDKGMQFIAISSNDAQTYPMDGPSHMKELGTSLNFPFPYLYDESQEVARAYEAACTPDFYVFNGQMKCVYRGQFDNSRPNNNEPVTGEDLTSALDDLLKGQPISAEQKPSVGCNIKWK